MAVSAGTWQGRGETHPEENGDYPVGGVADEYTPSAGSGRGRGDRAIGLFRPRVGERHFHVRVSPIWRDETQQRAECGGI